MAVGTLDTNFLISAGYRQATGFTEDSLNRLGIFLNFIIGYGPAILSVGPETIYLIIQLLHCSMSQSIQSYHQ